MLKNTKQVNTETVKKAPQNQKPPHSYMIKRADRWKRFYIPFTFYPLALISTDYLNMPKSELDHSCKAVWYQKAK